MTNIVKATIPTFKFLLLIFGVMIIGGCGNMQLGQPYMGESQGYPRGYDVGYNKLKSYDLSKLQEDRGLFIFSYEIIVDTITLSPESKNNKIVGASGVCVWEHKFNDESPKKFTKQGLIPLFKDADKIPLTEINLVWWLQAKSEYDRRFLAQYKGPEFNMTYHQGRVVYGGRIIIDPTVGRGFRVEQHFDEDMLPILEPLRSKQPDLEVLISPMSRWIPPVNNSWKN